MYDKAPLLATQRDDHGSSAAMIQYGMPGATAANLRAGSAVQNFFDDFFVSKILFFCGMEKKKRHAEIFRFPTGSL